MEELGELGYQDFPILSPTSSEVLPLNTLLIRTVTVSPKNSEDYKELLPQQSSQMN